jgi:RNA polymerase sigma factor FliA
MDVQACAAPSVETAMPILRATAKRVWRRLCARVDQDELLSIGYATLPDALARFDPGRGPFTAYLVKRLTWAMISAARRVDRRFDASRGTPLGATPIPESLPDPSQRDTCESTAPESRVLDELDPEDELVRRDMRRTMRAALAALPPASREILERHYFDGEDFATLARSFGISSSRACRLHKRALALLARELRERGALLDS